MALINCNECGKKISDKAAACPYCGYPINQLEPVTLRFHWAGKKGGSIRKTTVIVDGKEVGIMECGGYMNTVLNAGVHKIDLYHGKHKLIEDEIKIGPHQKEAFYAFKETMGFSHAQLKPIDAGSVKWPLVTSTNTPKCPTCGSNKIKKISMTKKVFSFEMVGFASGSIGKTFECKDCGYKW